MRYKIIFVLLFYPLLIFPQHFENDEIGQLERLTDKLTIPYSTELEKVRVIYKWIAENIEYDYENFKANNATSTNPIYIYQNRKGVCGGYSNLFKYMLELCDIESNVISGYARTNLQTIFLHKSNHAWNSVKINEKWYLFDVTWARDTISKQVDYFYFQTDPEIFILNHYPLEYEWTLLNKQYSLNEYMNFPIYSNIFHDLNFTEKISKDGYYIATKDTVTVKIAPRIECLLLTKLYDLEKEEWITNQKGDFMRNDDSFKLFIPRKGRFVLKLGVLIQDDNHITIYKTIIYYLIENK